MVSERVEMVQYLIDLIFNQSYMSLATCSDNVPWCTPVVYACDADMNFYWVSANGARHSINLVSNPSSSVAIFDPVQPQNSAQGIYVEGSVVELEENELHDATRFFYGWRYRNAQIYKEKLRSPSEFLDLSPRRMYKLSPQLFYALDPKGHPEYGNLLDHRVEISLTSEYERRYKIECSHVN